MGNAVLTPDFAECIVILICDSFSLSAIDAMQMVTREIHVFLRIVVYKLLIATIHQ